MAIAVKNNTVIGVEIEDTEGVYKAPTAATSFVQTLSDGTEMTPAKELLERNVFNGSIGKSTPRTGTRSVSGAVPTEFRAGEIEGAAPEYDALMRSGLGLRRQVTTTTVDATDSGGTHTTTRAYLDDADAGKYSIGDSITTQTAGAYHTSPVTATSDTPGDVYVDILTAKSVPFADGDVIAPVTTYTVAESGHPTLSISKYLETTILEQATGCRVTSISLENWATGQLASWGFSYEGLNFDRSITAQPFAPDYEDSKPPLILSACVFQNEIAIDVNSLSISVENTIGFATSTCSPNGKISSRVSERVLTGTFNPYKYDDNVDQFDKFDLGEEYSLFGFAYNPSTTTGEYANVCSVYIPQCLSTELSETDQDGLLQEEVSYSAGRGSDGTNNEIYISFS